jgi:flagellar L-ring protein precursor FlgH
MQMIPGKKLILFILLLMVAGCTARMPLVHEAATMAAGVHPHVPAARATPAGQTGKGSLWPGEGTTNNFFADNKAHLINDIVTIEIVESSTASKQATTKLGRSSELAAGVPNLFGLETKLDARLARVQDSNAAGTSNAAALNLSEILSASTKNDFDGSGVTTRTGELSGRMTAIVKEVLGNGNLKIQGKRVVIVNGEEQVMILTGIIRPEDISAQNVVLSTYIADAAISYYGMGVVADKQYPGWFARTFDRVWPF